MSIFDLIGEDQINHQYGEKKDSLILHLCAKTLKAVGCP